MGWTELTYRSLIDPQLLGGGRNLILTMVSKSSEILCRGFDLDPKSFRFNVFNGTHWPSTPRNCILYIIVEDQWPQKVPCVESQRPLRGARCVRSEVIDAIKTRSWEAQQGTRQQEETFQGACRANNRHHHDPWHPCMIYLTTFTRKNNQM